MGHKKRRANAMLHCVRGDKEPLGVWMVSSPVSGQAGRQPGKNILLTLLVDSKNTIQGSTRHVSPHIYNRFGAGFYVITLKLIQNKQTNKKKGAVFYDVTPRCTETTLGVSKSNSLLASKKNEKVCAGVWNHILKIMHSLIYM